MISKDIFKALRGIDPQFILDAAPDQSKRKNRKPLWLKWGALAACLCLIIGLVITFVLIDSTMEDPTYTPMIFNANQSPELLNGLPEETVVGNSGSSSGIMTAPPEFRFNVRQVVVKAKVVENYPDTYYRYYSYHRSDDYNKSPFRLIRMETLEVIHGQNIPKEFYYLIKPGIYVDLSVYDSLLISMTQIGTEQFVVHNDTKKQMEILDIPVFNDYQNSPELGNIIAFTDGVFDESLWQTDSWIYGYQFARWQLEDPSTGNLVVYRGDTEADAIAEIRKRIEEAKSNGGYFEPHLIKAEFQNKEVETALEWVKPFKNGVFIQELRLDNEYKGTGKLFFTRFINGCQTEETVSIDLTTEKVKYSKIRYTEEDLSKMENIALQIEYKAKAYKEQIPTPPHMDPEGKELIYLTLKGWYVKVDGKVYGIVKTTWRYKEKDDWYTQYFDESYLIYDAVSQTARYISREDLIDLVGRRNISKGEYGEKIAMPML